MRRAKKFLMNAAIMTVASVAFSAIGVSFSVYISSKIGPEGMGIYQLIFSILGFGVTLSVSGIGFTTTRLVAEELAVKSYSGIKSSVSKCIRYSLFFGILASTLLFVFGDFIAANWLHGKVSAKPLYIVAASLPFLSLSCVFNGYFTAIRQEYRNVAVQMVDQTVMIVSCVWLLSLVASDGLESASIALVLGFAISELLSCGILIVCYIISIRKFRKKTDVDPLLRKRLFKIALPIAVSSYIRSGLVTFKQIIVPIGLQKSGSSCQNSLSAYGTIKGMVFPVIMFPSSLLSAFSSLLIPEFAEKNVLHQKKRMKEIIERIFKITIIFTVFVSGALFVFANQLSLRIYKSEDPAIYIKILAPLVFVMYIDGIVDNILKGLNKQMQVVLINILDSVTDISLVFLLLQRWGIKGYMFIIIVTETLNGFLSILTLYKATDFSLHLVKWLVIPSAVTVLVLLAAKVLFKDVVIAILFSMICYAAILFLLRILTIKDFKV